MQGKWSSGTESSINAPENEVEMIKIGQCYVARFTKSDMPIRIEAVDAKGGWRARSLTHGRIVFVKNESQILRECSDADLLELAKTVVPNRRSKRQPPTQQLPTETPQIARVRKAKAKRPKVSEYSLTLLEAAYRVLREAKKPLTCQDIVDRAFKKKLHRSSGDTPQNTLNAALATEIKTKGEKSRYVKVGRAPFAVT
jgi:hypothetical protein